MADTQKKYLDAEGVAHLWGRLSMNDYPNNETLVAIIDAIDETKQNKEDEALTTENKTIVSSINELNEVHAADKAEIEADIKAIADDYLKGEDKEELQGNIDAVSAVANAAVKQSDYDTKVAALEAEDARIAGLVSAEAERAAGVEAGLEGRLEEVEAFFKLAEGEKLDTALDTLVEIQEYITSEGAAADQMVLDIAANKKAIEDHTHTKDEIVDLDMSEIVDEVLNKLPRAEEGSF